MTRRRNPSQTQHAVGWQRRHAPAANQWRVKVPSGCAATLTAKETVDNTGSLTRAAERVPKQASGCGALDTASSPVLGGAPGESERPYWPHAAANWRARELSSSSLEPGEPSGLEDEREHSTAANDTDMYSGSDSGSGGAGRRFLGRSQGDDDGLSSDTKRVSSSGISTLSTLFSSVTASPSSVGGTTSKSERMSWADLSDVPTDYTTKPFTASMCTDTTSETHSVSATISEQGTTVATDENGGGDSCKEHMHVPIFQQHVPGDTSPSGTCSVWAQAPPVSLPMDHHFFQPTDCASGAGGELALPNAGIQPMYSMNSFAVADAEGTRTPMSECLDPCEQLNPYAYSMGEGMMPMWYGPETAGTEVNCMDGSFMPGSYVTDEGNAMAPCSALEEAHQRALLAALSHQRALANFDVGADADWWHAGVETSVAASESGNCWPSSEAGLWTGLGEEGSWQQHSQEEAVWLSEEAQHSLAQWQAETCFPDDDRYKSWDGDACNRDAADQMSDVASTTCERSSDLKAMRPGRRSTGAGSDDGASSVGGGSRMSHHNVPKHTNFVEKYGSKKQDSTTVMVRNIPNQCTRKTLVDELDNLGLKGCYDFVYVPIDRNTRWNVGYAFVNFTTSEAASQCTKKFTGRRFNGYQQGKVIAVSPAHLQGLEANLKHYRDSAVQFSRLACNRPLVIGGE